MKATELPRGPRISGTLFWSGPARVLEWPGPFQTESLQIYLGPDSLGVDGAFLHEQIRIEMALPHAVNGFNSIPRFWGEK